MRLRRAVEHQANYGGWKFGGRHRRRDLGGLFGSRDERLHPMGQRFAGRFWNRWEHCEQPYGELLLRARKPGAGLGGHRLYRCRPSLCGWALLAPSRNWPSIRQPMRGFGCPDCTAKRNHSRRWRGRYWSTRHGLPLRGWRERPVTFRYRRCCRPSGDGASGGMHSVGFGYHGLFTSRWRSNQHPVGDRPFDPSLCNVAGDDRFQRRCCG